MSDETIILDIGDDEIVLDVEQLNSGPITIQSKYLGTFVSLVALEVAFPSPAQGSYANVDAGAGSDVIIYFWDSNDNKYVQGSGGAGDMSKAVYDPNEINGDAFDMANMTEAEDAKIMTTAERIKLANQSGNNTGDQDLSGKADADYNQTIVDGPTPALDLNSKASGIADWTSAQTAATLTLTNKPVKGVKNIPVIKVNVSDLVITFSSATTVFKFFDKSNNCMTSGTNCTLASGTANKNFHLSLVFTGMKDGSNNDIVHVMGTYTSFA